MKANTYTVDESGAECIIDSDGFQVMMAWEKPYMEALIDNLKPRGHVLEVGFGFGYSADQIMRYDIESYTVIECDDGAIERAKQWAAKQRHPVKVLGGFWQFEVNLIEQKFDTIFFDDSPRGEAFEITRESYSFYDVVLKKLANKGCRLSWYTQLPPWWNVHPATEYSCKTMSMEIPDHCRYFTDRMKKNKTMFLPVLEYPYGALTPEQAEVYLF